MPASVIFHERGGREVFTEIVAGVLVAIVFFQQLAKDRRRQDINAHAGQRFGRVGRHRRRVVSFSTNSMIFRFVDRHDAEADASSIGTGMQATVQRAFSTWSISMRSSPAYKYMVATRITRTRLVAADDIQVLRHRIPPCRDYQFSPCTLLSRQRIDKLVHLLLNVLRWMCCTSVCD